MPRGAGRYMRQVFIVLVATLCFVGTPIFVCIDDAYSFEFVTKHFRTFKQDNLHKKYGHLKLNSTERKLIKRGKYKNIAGRDIYYDDSLFSNDTKDAFGENNCIRMSSGKSPIAKDGIEVSIHHLQQMNDGILIETSTTYHRDHYKQLHKYKTKSEINRSDFQEWKKQYWRERWRMRCF